ncbi:hypothetical protein OG979_02620 [Actinomadura citrea]|uniref:hypothetical protein n=1 Tax=Actinomadura citrea TaxID=46158 RepID=UPI002E2A973F|nr:hypothetical protein [Actinomadura citrea]
MEEIGADAVGEAVGEADGEGVDGEGAMARSRFEAVEFVVCGRVSGGVVACGLCGWAGKECLVLGLRGGV